MATTGPDLQLTHRVLRADLPADVALLQGILERAPQYNLLVEGRPPALSAAADLFADLPPGGEASRKRVLAFLLDGEPVACADLYFGHPDATTAYLGLLLFDERWQGRGLGPRALAQLEGLASRAGSKALRLAVIASNPRGVHFWQREGFAEVTRRALSGYTGEAIVMQRAIAASPADPGCRPGKVG
jgi:GNAT superfamily N-acetyltransferase